MYIYTSPHTNKREGMNKSIAAKQQTFSQSMCIAQNEQVT